MHEMSVALEICRLAQERLAAAGPGTLVAVGVEVGDDAGLEVGNLEFCLQAAMSHPPFTSARPVLHRLPGDVLRLSYLEIDDGRPDD